VGQNHAMSSRVITLTDERNSALRLPASIVPDGLQAPGQTSDRLRRPLRDLRISVTDRCNFRCSYCMPKDVFDKDHVYLPHSALLSFEEITRLARSFLALGVRKIRLTGGEPLLRKNIESLIEQLAALKTLDGKPPELALTTNGSLLARKASALAAAGLDRVTVSLDGLDDTVFRRMNDVDFPVAEVLAGIDAAVAAGLGPVKVNMVVKRGTNDQEIVPMARHFRGTGVALRFIEFMDVGATNGWRMDEVMPSAEVIAQLRSALPLVQLPPTATGETAARWGYAGADGKHDPALGEVGVISSVSEPFCGSCNRARLSTEGRLFLCLFAERGYDLRELLREGGTDEHLQNTLAAIWHGRSDRYSEQRSDPASADHGVPSAGSKRVEMSYIGG
jgi:cyclic pyranopterin phosphate synthase